MELENQDGIWVVAAMRPGGPADRCGLIKVKPPSHSDTVRYSSAVRHASFHILEDDFAAHVKRESQSRSQSRQTRVTIMVTVTSNESHDHGHSHVKRESRSQSCQHVFI